MKFFAAVALAGFLAPMALAQPHTLAIDPAASQVKITLKTTHEIVNGSFHVDSGSIRFDRSSPDLSGTIVIAAASGKTGNGSRDKKMNKDILQVAQYATIAFAPKIFSGSIPAAGDTTIQVTGTFTLLGKPHEITIPVALHIEGSSATARAHFIVPYVQWGLKNPSFLIWKAENDVAVDLDLVGAISK